MKLFSTNRSDAGRAVVWVWEPQFTTYSRWAATYATPNGGPVLRDETGWRSWNGFVFRAGRKVVFVTFRRFWRL
jgi:hypothetical protein